MLIKKVSSISPTKKSLKKLREEGYLCEVTEHWNYFAKVRKDLFGFIDILAIKNNEVVAVQTTSYSNISERISKISNHENIGFIRKVGWKVVVHGWKGNKCYEKDLS